MNSKLARTLVQRGIIRQGTILEAFQSAKSLAGVCDSHKLMTYAVLGAKATSDTVTFETIGTDREKYRVPCEFVQTIDGMKIKRVAASHELDEDGNVVAVKRRRKTKENY